MSDWRATPWRAQHSAVINADDEIVCTTVIGTVKRNDAPEDWSTACLLAAAPDMAGALKETLDALLEIPGMDDPGNEAAAETIQKARAALQKARGKS